MKTDYRSICAIAAGGVMMAATMTAGLVWLCLVVGETGRGGDPCTS